MAHLSAISPGIRGRPCSAAGARGMSLQLEPPDNVTKLPVRSKDPRKIVALVEWDYKACKHLHAIVDTKAAELTCADCGAKINPIYFLEQLSQQLVRWEYEKRAAAKIRADLEERKRTRCTKCGEMTEIRRIPRYELEEIKAARAAAGCDERVDK